MDNEKIHIKWVKTINDHTSYVRSLLLLRDKRIASYHCNQELTNHDGISSICKLDGTIVSCLNIQSITIGDYTIKNSHDASLFKVLTLP